MASSTYSGKYFSKFSHSSERELWTSNAEQQHALSVHVKDVLMERQLRCCLERIRWKLARYEKYGVPDHDRPYVSSLRLSEDALAETLGLEVVGQS